MSRLDVELVSRELFTTRSKAQLAIKDGIITCDGKVVTKAGFEVSDKTKIEIIGEVLPYVSRGGLKLAKAIEVWKIDLTNKIMLDIGASTGGFSDVAIKNNVLKIYAIDVGTDQFDKALAQNPKIILMEKTDFRTIDNSKISDANIACIDVSFISVTKLIPKLESLTGILDIICLIKPQFECGKKIADKYKGVILDENVRKETIKRVVDTFYESGFINIDVITSPIKGGDGNTEYLALFKRKNII